MKLEFYYKETGEVIAEDAEFIVHRRCAGYYDLRIDTNGDVLLNVLVIDREYEEIDRPDIGWRIA